MTPWLERGNGRRNPGSFRARSQFLAELFQQLLLLLMLSLCEGSSRLSG